MHKYFHLNKFTISVPRHPIRQHPSKTSQSLRLTPNVLQLLVGAGLLITPWHVFGILHFLVLIEQHVHRGQQDVGDHLAHAGVQILEAAEAFFEVRAVQRHQPDALQYFQSQTVLLGVIVIEEHEEVFEDRKRREDAGEVPATFSGVTIEDLLSSDLQTLTK